MKNITIPLIFFYCLTISSQKSNDYHGNIIYNQVTNFGFEFIEEYQLVFTKNWSYSEEININKKESYQTSNSDNNGTSTINVIGRKNTTPKYYYNTNNTFFFRDNFSDNIFVVKETPSFPKWNLINETKKIGDFDCKKAVVNFRGRTYYAWYTLQIPLPFGPWKARGLPGIILELYETDYAFHIIAKKIIINNQTSLNVTLPIKEIEEAISIDEYVVEKEKIKDLFFQKLSSKQPKGSKPIKRDKNCEDCSKGLEIFDERN